jgi:pimeloyl-ACP methyl ester carboxylesterase
MFDHCAIAPLPLTACSASSRHAPALNRRRFLEGGLALAALSAIPASAKATPAVRMVNTPSLRIGYEEVGPADGQPVFLLHGWPYDPRSFDDVVSPLASAGFRVIVPYLRCFGPTVYCDSSIFRSGEQATLGKDVIDLMDALSVPKAILAGFDWGNRAACVAAALWPERVRAFVSTTGCTILNVPNLTKNPGRLQLLRVQRTDDCVIRIRWSRPRGELVDEGLKCTANIGLDAACNRISRVRVLSESVNVQDRRVAPWIYAGGRKFLEFVSDGNDQIRFVECKVLEIVAHETHDSESIWVTIGNGEPVVNISHEGRALFVAREDETDFGTCRPIDKPDVLFSLNAEHVFDTLRLETRDHQTGNRHLDFTVAHDPVPFSLVVKSAMHLKRSTT